MTVSEIKSPATVLCWLAVHTRKSCIKYCLALQQLFGVSVQRESYECWYTLIAAGMAVAKCHWDFQVTDSSWEQLSQPI